jgi:anti-sigma factor RsiW
MSDGQIPCARLVELITEWIEGGLDEPTRSLVEEHLDLCPPCRAYLDQVRQAMAALRQLDADDADEGPPPAVRAELLDLFRAQHDH